MSKKEINLILGSRVRACRKQSGITREQLAERINVSVRFLADVESGIVGVSLSTLKELCHACDCSADYLIGNNDNPTNSVYDRAIHKLKTIPAEKMGTIELLLDAVLKLL